MTEVYKDISGYAGYYQVSNLGNVRRLPHLRVHNIVLRNQSTHKSGYKYICLCVDSKKHSFRVHRLVAIAFVDNPNGHEFVNHIDADKTNNAADNLEWCTHSHNIRHMLALGLRDNSKCGKKGEDNDGAKLTCDDVRVIRKRLIDGESCVRISSDYSVHPDTIGSIKRGRSWSHVT